MTCSPARSALLDQLADQIVTVVCNHPVRVAIDGISASGKTVLADELAQRISARGRPVIRAALDGFHHAAAIRYRQGRDSVAGYVDDSFDLVTMRRVLLEPLGPGGDRRYRSAVYDLHDESPVSLPEAVAADDAVLICEGVMLLRPPLDDCFDLRVLVQISDQEAVRRGCRRDAARLGGEAEVARKYRDRYLAGQGQYLRQHRPDLRADVLIDNEDPDRPVMLARAPA
ncbi:MAG: uridine kinase [Planctomycetota bacterium]|nr:uridine kinase [Planctomycetota bacterium]